MSWPVPVTGMAGALAAVDTIAPAVDGVGDNELILQAAAGDRAAWGALVQRYLDPLSAYAWYMLGDQAEAEDVAQETFLRLMGKVRDWDCDGSARLKTWLYRVAINLCIDRRRKHQPVPMETLPEPDPPPPGEAETEIDRTRAVREALTRLPERQRAVMALVYYQGFSQREVAELMTLSVDAVESLLARARRALRATLAPLREELMGRE